MKATENWRITIIDNMDNEVSGGFTFPEDVSPEDLNDSEKMEKFGKNLLEEYFKQQKAVEEFEQKMLDNCTCFWKDKPEDERFYNRCHSSECATWEME